MRSVMAQSAGLVNSLGVVISIIIVKSKTMYFEYRIVKIEKGLFLIEYKTAPYGVWHEVKNKQFKTKPKAEAWARKNLV